MLRLALLLFATLTLLSACDPGWGIQGQVTSSPDGGTPGPPVSAATVHVMCPGVEPIALETDDEGKLEHSQLGMLDEACTIEVQGDGFLPRRYSIEEVCRHRYRLGAHRCHSLELDAQLHPRVQ